MTDGHFSRYQEMLDQLDWNKYGVVNGVARDSRCENCMVHCGYEQSGALGTNYQAGDNWKNIKFNFGARPAPYLEGRKINPFNGFTIGKGHLAEAKAAINTGSSGPKTMFHQAAGSCGSGDTSQRDALLAKVHAAKKGESDGH
jgi:Domain of unknown function (DUF3463)